MNFGVDTVQYIVLLFGILVIIINLENRNTYFSVID